MKPLLRSPGTRRVLRDLAGVAVLVILVVQFQGMRSLRTENTSLRTQSRRLRSLEEDRLELQRLRTLLAEPERVRRDILELHRLRREIQDLRAGRTNGSSTIEPLDPETNSVVELDAPDPPPVQALFESTKAEWQYRGFETPLAAAETILWAGRENRVDVFLDSFVPEIRAEFESALAASGVSPELDSEDSPITQALGLRVLTVLPRGANEVEMTYIVDGWHDDKPFRQPLRQTTNGWKFAGDPQDVE